MCLMAGAPLKATVEVWFPSAVVVPHSNQVLALLLLPGKIRELNCAAVSVKTEKEVVMAVGDI